MADQPNEGVPLPPPLETKRPSPNTLSLGLEILSLIINLYISLGVAVYRLFVPLPPKDISGQVVLITGAGRGLGQGLAKEFARHGCKVACADIQTDLNAETVSQLNEYAPGCAKGYFCDVGSFDSVQELKTAVLKDFGRVDILVNNAGLIVGGTILAEDFKVSWMEKIARVNFLSHIWTVRTFLPDMIERNSGHIVCISSMSALCGLQNANLYTACKWAITGFMESIRENLRHNRDNQVRTSVVMPFFINTSAEYVKSWDIRVPELSVGRCARSIVHGVRQNLEVFTVPEENYYAACFVKLLPMNVRDQFYDIFSAKVKDQKPGQFNQYNAFKIATGEYKPKTS